MQTSLLDTNANNSLQIDTEVRKNLRVTARWAIFLAIISFIFYGLILAVIIGLITLGPSYVGPINIEAATIKVLIIYLVIIVISMIPFVAMFRFSRSTKAALTSDNQRSLVKAMKNMKIIFQFYGIMMVIIIAMYVIAIIYISIIGANFLHSLPPLSK